MMNGLTILTPAEAQAALPQLIALLQDAVDGGASLGFLPPLAPDEARPYWEQVIADMARGTHILIAALDAGQVIGSVQVALTTKSTAHHRCEIQKLCVHSSAWRRGIGAALMHAAETAARAAGRSLIVLDTRRGDAAERLYTRLGYITAGSIPRFTRDADGQLHDTVLFYRWIA